MVRPHNRPLKRHRDENGFSILELLVALAIIMVIAAIAIPNYFSSRMAANESSACGTLRTMNTALALYVASYSSVGYPPTLVELTDGGNSPCTPSSTQACLIDLSLASGTKSGYTFTYAPDTSASVPPGYTIHADPISRGSTGRRSFFTDQPGVIHYNPAGPATVNDPPIPM
jgi:type IV pilus assembly protein PilA